MYIPGTKVSINLNPYFHPSQDPYTKTSYLGNPSYLSVTDL